MRVERRAPNGIFERALVFGTAFLIAFWFGLPLAVVAFEALRDGLPRYFTALLDPGSRASMALTLEVVSIVVPLNAAFGLAAAWAIAHYEFAGKSLLASLIDLPFSISPVVCGLLFVLLFGARGLIGPFLIEHGIRVVFAVPAMVLATTFVTLPLIARELIPLMEAQGSSEEEAAASLGAGGWSILGRVTLPRVRWALFYGAVLAAARAAGEFGAVSVVSGHVRGETITLPLQVEILYNEYQFSAAFAVASTLAMTGLVTIALKAWLERRMIKRK